MVLFYLNLLILLPDNAARKTRTPYFIIIFILVAFFTWVFGSLDIYLEDALPLDLPHLQNRPKTFFYIGRLMSSIPPVIISALIFNSFLLERKRKESLELENKILEAESRALKAQINPHFLFNTLNNIYSLSQLDASKTGDAILQLSDILRYVTYEGDEKRVPLTSEVEHIKSFIKLQLLRDDDNSNIDVSIDIEEGHQKISPLLLIPFIENCFKHGNQHDKANGYIKISIKATEKRLTLITENGIQLEGTKKDRVGGVGMENVKRRLALLYPNKHELVIRTNKTTYTTILKLNLIP